jgi:hypothetical protein
MIEKLEPNGPNAERIEAARQIDDCLPLLAGDRLGLLALQNAS